jgi:DNA-binding SARP family transcriptional activator
MLRSGNMRDIRRKCLGRSLAPVVDQPTYTTTGLEDNGPLCSVAATPARIHDCVPRAHLFVTRGGAVLLLALFVTLLTACVRPSPVQTVTAISTPEPKGVLDSDPPCAGTHLVDLHPSDPLEAVAIGAFQVWNPYPYRNLRLRVLSNDGSFARTITCADVRVNPNAEWETYAHITSLQRVGDRWTTTYSATDYSLMPARAMATQQAVDRAQQAAEDAASAARNSLVASVESIEYGTDDLLNRAAFRVTLRLQTNDHLRHRYRFDLAVDVTLQECDYLQQEGRRSKLSPLGGVEEEVGPEGLTRVYSFTPASMSDLDAFGVLRCKGAADPGDVRVQIRTLDGISADAIQRTTQRLMQAAPTPVPNAIASLSPTVSARETVQPDALASRESGANGVSLSFADDTPDGNSLVLALLAIPIVFVAIWLTRSRVMSGTERARRKRVLSSSRTTIGMVAADALGANAANPLRDTNDTVVGVKLSAPEIVRKSDGEDGLTSEVRVAQAVEHSAPAAPIRIVCFGGPRISYGDRALWPSPVFTNERKSLELFLFLAASDPEGVDRDAVGNALWPDVDIADTAGSLRQLRRRLRLVLARAAPGLPEEAPFTADTGRILRLDRAIVWTDVHEFTELSRTARTVERSAAVGMLERARGLATAGFFESPSAPPYSWAIDPGPDGTSLRQQLRRSFEDVTFRLGELYTAEPNGSRANEAIEIFESLLEREKQDERVWRALFRARAARGDRAGLERDWQRLLQTLKSDGPTSEPLVETADMYARIRAQLQSSYAVR